MAEEPASGRGEVQRLEPWQLPTYLRALEREGVTEVTWNREALTLPVAQQRAAVYTSDYLNDARFSHDPAVDDAVRREGIKSILGVPMKAFDTFVGACSCR